MGCNCGSKNRATAAGGSVTADPSTYRVYVGDRKVYETTSEEAANTVSSRFADARVLSPGVKA